MIGVHRRRRAPPPPKRLHAAASSAPTATQLLDLPEDALLAIFLRLPFLDRLRLARVCRRLRQLCAGPSPLWRDVVLDRKLRRKADLERDAQRAQQLDALCSMLHGLRT